MADLWSLTIAFRGVNTSIRLTYSNDKDALEAYAALKMPQEAKDAEDRGLVIAASDWDTEVEIVDNYGSTLTVNRSDIMAHWVTNMGAEMEGKVDADQLAAHAQAKLQRRLAADPMLKGIGLATPPSLKLNS